jgi:hypothetical protein
LCNKMESRNLYQTLFKTGMLTDYKIDVISTSVRASYNLHKSLLALNSQYFYALFNSQDVPKSPRVQLETPTSDIMRLSVFKMDDNDIEAFQDVVIPYIYHDENLQITSHNYLSVIFLADFFQMSHLLTYVKEKFISPYNIIDAIESYGSVQRPSPNQSNATQTFLEHLITKAKEFLPQLQPRQIERLTEIEIFLRILQNEDASAEHVSDIVCSWIRMHRDLCLEGDNFERLSKYIIFKFSNVLLLHPIAVHENVKQMDVANLCMEIIADNFYTVSKNSDIAACPVGAMVDLLSHDDLIIENESRILDAICTYLDNVSPSLTDQEELTSLWSTLKILQLSDEGWLKYVHRDDVPFELLRESARRRAKLSVSKDPKSLLQTESATYYTLKDIPYNEDNKGVLFWLGANQGSEPLKYVNPCTLGLVSITTTNTNNIGEINDILKYSNKESRVALEHNGTITVDLGSCRLNPNHYTIHAANTATAKNWRLRASSDGINYDTIKVHHNDFTLEGSLTGSWQCTNVSKCYRFLQVQMVGQSAENDFELEVSGLEFYGRLVYNTSNCNDV